MFKATWRSLMAHKARMLLSALAVVLGVAFVVGTFIFTDTLKGTFNTLFDTEAPDVVVTQQLSGLGGQESGAAVSEVPNSVLEEIDALQDTQLVTGDVQALGVAVLDKEGKPIGGAGPPQLGLSYPEFPDNPQLNGGITLVEGRAPTAPREVVLDETTAEKGGFTVGDTVSIITQGPRIEAPLVGLARFGAGGGVGGATLAMFEQEYAQTALLGKDVWSQVSAVGTFGVPAERLRDQVIAAIGSSDFIVATGEEVQSAQAEEFSEAFGFINTFLLVFAMIALFVGVFIILNTFSMLVARRTKELALLRAIGASRAQITWSVLGEAFLLGLFGGAMGVLSGIAVAAGLRALLVNVIGVDLPSGPLVIEPRTIIWGLLLGVIVTLVAAWFPARRASRVPPVAAMRDDVALPPRGLQVRAVVGTVLAVAGVALMLWALANPGADGRLQLAGLAAAAILIGVIVLAPVFSRVMVSVVGYPVGKLGSVGQLAVRNAQRDRRRTAATASAILIGLTLVTTIGVLGASLTKSINSIIDDVISADVLITPSGFTPFSPDVAEAAREVPGVATVSQVRQAPALVDGARTFVTAVDPATISQAIRLEVDPTTLTAGGIVTDTETAAAAGLAVGETVEVNWGSAKQTLRVDGTYEPKSTFSGYVVALDTLREAGLPEADTAVYVILDQGANHANVMAGLDEVSTQFPTITIQDQTELKESISSQISQVLNLIYALLALSVFIAIIGVINTLALSVIERTREIGMLRAVGTTRKQVRAMIRWESMVICVFGAVTGVLLGLGLGIAAQRLFAEDGITRLGVPAGVIVTVLVGTAIVGVLAALWPARRAARLDVLDAIRTE